MLDWLRRKTPTHNWALVAFFVLTINGIVDLVELVT